MWDDEFGGDMGEVGGVGEVGDASAQDPRLAGALAGPLSYPQVGPPVPRPPPPPEEQSLPVPWSPADDMQVMKLKKAMDTIQQDFYAGKIRGDVFHPAVQQVQQRLQPLLQRQQQTQQQQKQMQKMALLDSTATEEAVRGEHQKLRAQTFPSTVTTYTDRLTGESEHFYQDSKGDWKPIEFRAHRERTAETDPQGSMAGVLPSFRGFPVGAGLATAPALDSPQPLGQQAEPGVAAGTPPVPAVENLQQFRARILNGAGQDITEQQSQQETPQRQWWLPPQQPPGRGSAAGEDLGLTQQQLAEIYRRAEGAVPPLPANAGPHQHLARQQEVAAVAERQASAHMEVKRLSIMRKLAAEEHQRQEAARSEEAKRHEAAKVEETKRREQEKKAGQDEFSKSERSRLYLIYERAARERLKEWQEIPTNLGQTPPKELTDEDLVDRWVMGKVNRHMRNAHGIGTSGEATATPEGDTKKPATAAERMDQKYFGKPPAPTPEQVEAARKGPLAPAQAARDEWERGKIAYRDQKVVEHRNQTLAERMQKTLDEESRRLQKDATLTEADKRVLQFAISHLQAHKDAANPKSRLSGNPLFDYQHALRLMGEE